MSFVQINSGCLALNLKRAIATLHGCAFAKIVTLLYPQITSKLSSSYIYSI